MYRKAVLLLISVMCACACHQQVHAPHFIFDTDLGGDIDDVLALEMLVNYHKAGEIVLDGVILSKSNPLAVRFTDGYLRWHGLGDEVPIGWVYEGKSPEDFYYMIPTLEAEYEGRPLLEPAPDVVETVPEGYKLMRKILAGSPDSSVQIVSVGMFTNLQRLLESEPDEYSGLDGVELVRRKVAGLHIMGGVFAGEPFPESNVITDLEASKAVIGGWPGNMTASGFEIGVAALYPHESVENDFGEPGSHPLNVAYTHWGPMPYDRPSWDLTSVFEAVEGGRGIFEYSPAGTITVDDAGCVSFAACENGKHRYLILPEENIESAKKALVSVVSGKRFQK